jgi:hypothetical protein
MVLQRIHLLQNANGTFGAATNFTVGNNPNYIAIGDFNGDNNPDLATSNSSLKQRINTVRKWHWKL